MTRARASVAPVFDRIARFYDTEIVQLLGYRPAQDEVVRELRAAGARRIVDVGCGTGILAARLRQELRPEVVYGIDASEGMLAQAVARDPSVQWRQARAEALPLRDEEVDAVVSTHAFHFFDKPAALAEFHRVLAPGGRVVVVLASSPTRALSRLPLLGGSASFPTRDEMRELLEGAGFEIVDQRRVRRPLQWMVHVHVGARAETQLS
jgi:ubiquinone/menaquinone biosynthesis C-methylase UbiE